MDDRTKIMYAVTHPMSAKAFLRGQLRWFREQGADVLLVASGGEGLPEFAASEGVEFAVVEMAREISPLRDLGALLRLHKLVRTWRPDIVIAGTPKAGLLGMIASWAAGVPKRVYQLHGLRLETATGLKRALLTVTERVASGCSHRVLAVSPSLATRYVSLGLGSPDKVRVPAAYSANGVDPTRFRPLPSSQVLPLKASLGIDPGAHVIGFVGRLTKDKGVGDLLSAYNRVRNEIAGVHLLLVGDFEAGDPVSEGVVRELRSRPDITVTGFVDDPTPYYNVMDVLAFPSLREGFGMVPLEAAATGRPAIAYRVTGVVDAIKDGETGVLVEPGDVEALARAIQRYVSAPPLREQHGVAGRERALCDFAPVRVWEALMNELDDLPYSG